MRKSVLKLINEKNEDLEHLNKEANDISRRLLTLYERQDLPSIKLLNEEVRYVNSFNNQTREKPGTYIPIQALSYSEYEAKKFKVYEPTIKRNEGSFNNKINIEPTKNIVSKNILLGLSVKLSHLKI